MRGDCHPSDVVKGYLQLETTLPPTDCHFDSRLWKNDWSVASILIDMLLNPLKSLLHHSSLIFERHLNTAGLSSQASQARQDTAFRGPLSPLSLPAWQSGEDGYSAVWMNSFDRLHGWVHG